MTHLRINLKTISVNFGPDFDNRQDEQQGVTQAEHKHVCLLLLILDVTYSVISNDNLCTQVDFCMFNTLALIPPFETLNPYRCFKMYK